MTGVVVVISGFDRGTDKLMIEVPLPAWAVSATRAIAGVPVDDPDLVGAYPLTERIRCARSPLWLRSSSIRRRSTGSSKGTPRNSPLRRSRGGL
jgi:hypothetical protein